MDKIKNGEVEGDIVAKLNNTQSADEKNEQEIKVFDGADEPIIIEKEVINPEENPVSNTVVMTDKEPKKDKPKEKKKLLDKMKEAWKNTDKKELTLIYSFLIIAAFIRAVAMHTFANPFKVSAGGITGLTTILVNYVEPLKNASDILMFAFNFPLLILAFFFLNKKFALYTILETILTSLFLTLLKVVNFPVFTGEEHFLAAIMTGALNGFGLGLLLRANCSTGGNDIVGLLIQNKFPQVKVVWLILILDSAVAISAGFVNQFVVPVGATAPEGTGLNICIYSFIALFVNSFVAEKIQRGFVSSVKFEVVTSKQDEVGKVITDVFHRSATMFEGYGMYTKKPRTMIVAVVRKREAVSLKKMISEIDPKAFFYVTNIHEIVGNGFMVQVNAKSKIK